MSTKKTWFAIGRAAHGAAISIHSDIGDFGIGAGEFARQLQALGSPKELRISINSNGGDVSTGFAIYNMLNRHPANKIVTVEGIAASMASVIAMAGDEIVMPSNAMLMIHNPWGAITGKSDEIASFADALEMMQSNMAAVYRARSGQSLATIRAMMDRETWLDASAAVEKGFADRIEEPMKAVASVDLSRFANAPTKRPTSSLDSLDSMEIWARWNSAKRSAP
jgi:ATP-dependent Clp endopeptidase proteolytic subunit ClpP